MNKLEHFIWYTWTRFWWMKGNRKDYVKYFWVSWKQYWELVKD